MYESLKPYFIAPSGEVISSHIRYRSGLPPLDINKLTVSLLEGVERRSPKDTNWRRRYSVG